MHKQYGFTLVELLIVIVVIAVLASVTIVAYSGITDRAKQAAIRSDMVNFSQLVELSRVDTGVYPGTASLVSLGFHASQSSYPNQYPWNLDYCYSTDNLSYILSARLNSKNSIYVSSKNTDPRVIDTSANAITDPSACYNGSPGGIPDRIGLTGITAGYSGRSPSGWRDWAK